MSSAPRIYVAGHRGMVGSAIVRTLIAQGVNECDIVTRTHGELDLTDQRAVQEFFASEKPDQVYLAAAKVGGIYANNTYPAEFIYQNLILQANVIHAAHMYDVQKLLFLGSSCIYPKLAPQPMAETALLTGTLEPTNEPYAVAKIAGIKLCESYTLQGYARNQQCCYQYIKEGYLTVYIPSHNYGRFLSEAIESVLRQSVKDWELFVIDDGSTDDTAAVMKLYEAHPQIRLFSTEGTADTLGVQAAKWGCTGWRDFDVMMRHVQPQLVSFAVPASVRPALMLQALNYDCVKAVVAEKPLANSLEEAAVVVAAYRDRRVPLVVNYSRRFVPAWQALAGGSAMSATIKYAKGTFGESSSLWPV